MDQEQIPDAGTTTLLAEFNTKLRDIEERQRLIKDRVLLIGENLVDGREDSIQEISELKAQEILRSWKEKSFSPMENIKEYKQISNEKDIEKIVDDIIRKNKQAVEDYKSGKKWAINFLIGKVMEATNKRADYKTAKEVLVKKLR